MVIKISSGLPCWLSGRDGAFQEDGYQRPDFLDELHLVISVETQCFNMMPMANLCLCITISSSKSRQVYEKDSHGDA